MGRIPEHLAARLPDGALSLATAVRAVTAEGLRTADEETFGADAVIVATEPVRAAALVPRSGVRHGPAGRSPFGAAPDGRPPAAPRRKEPPCHAASAFVQILILIGAVAVIFSAGTVFFKYTARRRQER
ncbi:hypothetical protein ACFQY7_45625 [Actinomadura luteofluorescens]|uniref:hypothetical protein n=1 Tax=Actinomadura luteofluorescens TaxID=46163 RepID=UPI0035E41962